MAQFIVQYHPRLENAFVMSKKFKITKLLVNQANLSGQSKSNEKA